MFAMHPPITYDNVRQLLMKCVVRNAEGIKSIRFTEHVSFELWANLIRSRHGIEVTSAIPCIWVPVHEFDRRRRLYEGAELADPVTRIVVTLFDPETSITERKTRFLTTDEWESGNPIRTDATGLGADTQLQQLVLDHLFESHKECLHTTYAGMAIATSRSVATSHAA